MLIENDQLIAVLSSISIAVVSVVIVALYQRIRGK